MDLGDKKGIWCPLYHCSSIDQQMFLLGVSERYLAENKVPLLVGWRWFAEMQESWPVGRKTILRHYLRVLLRTFEPKISALYTLI